MKKIGIIQFPGTNCEYDCLHVLRELCELDAKILWHGDRIDRLADYGCLLLPGGFAHGDYLRAGAMTILSPIMEDVLQFATQGGLIIGICNGFQVLTELKLLPGALLTNASLKYACQDVYVRLEGESPFTSSGSRGSVYKMPVSHQQGCYFIDDVGLAELKKHDQIALRYCNASGALEPSANPNGSVENIAGITNREKNILGLMPHPDRCAELVLGHEDGQLIFSSLKQSLAA